MKLYEYSAKELFRGQGIPVPKGEVAASAAEAGAIADRVGYPVAIKAQALTGGRGKAGGIKFASDRSQAEAAAASLFGTTIKGFPVERLLVEEKLTIDQELYIGLMVEASRKCPLLMLSPDGGVDIEQVEESRIAKVPIDVCFGISPYMVRQACAQVGFPGTLVPQIADVAERLYRLMFEYDAEMVEINPLVVSGDRVIAADARCTIDDFAVYRHPGLPRTVEGTPLEQEIRSQGLAFVELDGDIALLANGAGVTMAIIDMIADYGGSAANFLDTGGGASEELTYKGLKAIMRTNPKVVLISIFAGISKCDDVARAIVQVINEDKVTQPFVVRLVGINRDLAAEILSTVGIVPLTDLEEAVQRAVALAKGAE